MKNKIFFIIGVIILAIAGFFALIREKNSRFAVEQKNTEKKAVETQYTKSVFIEPGKTFGIIMKEAGIATSTSQQIFSAAKSSYDLSNIKAGGNLFLTYKINTDEFIRLMYPISSEEELYVQKKTSTSTEETWDAERKKIEYDIKLKIFKGEIKNSLYADGLERNIPEGTIIEFADIFEYAVDYAYDIRAGDTFAFVVEERSRDGKFADLGRIHAGKFINAGKTYFSYYFTEDEENKGYYDEEGNSVQKMFLRAPVAFRYISSGFTTGPRYIKEFNISTGHRAIDYATAYGTPIRSVGDGTVTFAGWSKAGYGYLTTIRHNSTYSTNYAHQSKILVKKGQRVKQGQIIGSVGSTGLSTGPHLHYEMVKNGIKINPLREVLPPGKPIKKENRDRYFLEIEKYKNFLEK